MQYNSKAAREVTHTDWPPVFVFIIVHCFVIFVFSMRLTRCLLTYSLNTYCIRLFRQDQIIVVHFLVTKGTRCENLCGRPYK